MIIYELWDNWLNKWEDSVTIEDSIIYNDLWYWNYWIQDCKKIDNWDNKNKLLLYHDWYRDPVSLCTLPTRMVSQEVKDILENELWINREIEQVQFLPIPIVDMSLREQIEWKTLEEMEKMWIEIIKDYYVLNVLILLDNNAINKEKSIWWPMVYEKPVFNKKYVEWYDFFRVDWSNIAFYVSQRVFEAIQKLDMKNLKEYIKTNEWNLRKPKKRYQKSTLIWFEREVIE